MQGKNFTINLGSLEVITERTINASAAKLFKDYTDPLLIPKWWGESSWVTSVDAQNLRVGGSWRFLQTDPNNTSFVWSGTYQEFDQSSKIVSTFVLEARPEHTYVGTALFSQLSDGTTHLTETIKFLNASDLGLMVAMGMKNKTSERLDRFASIAEN